FPATSPTDTTDTRFGGIEARPAEMRAMGAATSGGAPGQAPSSVTQTPQQAIGSTFASLDTSLFANYDLGLEMSVPSAAEELIATVTTKEFLSAFPATARFEFFRAADGATFVNIGAIIKAEDLYPPGTIGKSNLRLYANVTPAGPDAGASRYVASEGETVFIDPAKGPTPGGVYDVWAGVPVKAGRH